MTDLSDQILDDMTGTYAPTYFDREGNRISLRRKCELGRDLSYKLLRTTVVPAGEVVSAWIGETWLDVSDGSAPYIYGTILRRGEEDYDHDIEVLANSEENCLADHERIVRELSV
jgi:hypothetical protein